MRRHVMEEGPRVAVVGAGIGGLALAGALARAGMRCEVYEQTKRLAEVGAGVQLAPNAVRPLRRLGIGPALRARGVRIEATEIRGWDGRLVARTPLGEECERLFGAPYYTVHRADLHEALVNSVPADQLHLGHRLRRVEEDADGVTLRFEDGATRRADVVVGADGIHSAVRDALVHDEPVFSGLGVYRGLLPMERLPRSATRDAAVRLWLGPGAHIVCYPVSGGAQVSFAATAPLAEPTGESWTAEADAEDLVREFGDWRGLPAQIANAVRAAGRVRRWALHDREPLQQWSTARLTVLGDAAHPMLPFMAQGANQAVEDAFDLAGCLAGVGSDGVPAALARYESLRAPRTASIQQGSRGNGDVLHLPDGEAQRERDEAMRRMSALQHRAPLFSYQAGRPAAAGPATAGVS